MLKYFLFILPVIIVSCNRNQALSDGDNSNDAQYAMGFTLSSDPEIISLYYNGEKMTYGFSENGASATTQFVNRDTPRYVCLSSTHVAFLQTLGEAHHIVGTPDSSFIYNEEVKKFIREGKIAMISDGAGLDEELILDLEPTLIFTDHMRKDEMQLFIRTGIPIVYIEEFREISPLARAEWIKVFGAFVDKMNLADSLFSAVENRYRNISRKVNSQVENRPEIFGGMEFQGIWYVSGGASYISQLYSDAGANYIFNDNDKDASIPLDFEVVIDRGRDCDFWRVVYGSNSEITYELIAGLNRHYAEFMAFKNRSIIACNPSKTPYFEQGVLEPDVLLMDLAVALHPGIFDTVYYPKYYKLLK